MNSINEKPYFIAHQINSSRNNLTSSSKNSSQRVHTNHTYYEQLLLTKSPTKNSKTPASDKLQIHFLQQQITDLKHQVDLLRKENTRLQLQQDQSLDRLKSQFVKMTQHAKLLKKVNALRLENIALKQDMQLISKEIQTIFSPLKALVNHVLCQPQDAIISVLQITQKQLEASLSMEKNRAELLNSQRGDLLNELFTKDEKISDLLLQANKIPKVKD